MKKILFLLLITFSLFPESPENRIIVVENFISSEDARTLMQYYNSKNRILNVASNNQIAFSSISNTHIRKIISKISNRVLQAMRLHYSLGQKNYHLDHAGLYARITGNSCSYHSDNIKFTCPIHGENQEQLRIFCKGSCPGAKYIPNHTSWREYTALIYLNDDFTGGEIRFEDGPFNKIYRKLIPIKANLLILAPNGPNFYHEVLPIKSGTR